MRWMIGMLVFSVLSIIGLRGMGDEPIEGQKPAKPPAAAAQQAIETILRVRESVLENSVLGVDSEEDARQFREALLDIAKESAQQTPPPLQPDPSLAPASLPFSEEQTATLIGSLRQSARLLDNKANDLEEVEQYEQADKVRHLAQALRLQARTFRPQASAASSAPQR